MEKKNIFMTVMFNLKTQKYELVVASEDGNEIYFQDLSGKEALKIMPYFSVVVGGNLRVGFNGSLTKVDEDTIMLEGVDVYDHITMIITKGKTVKLKVSWLD